MSVLGLTAFTRAAEMAVGGPLLGFHEQGSAPSATPATPARSGGDARPSGRGGPGQLPPWWNDPAVRKEIGLSAEKAKKIDDMYQSRWKELKPTSDEFDQERDKLATMTRAAVVDLPQYRLQVLKVEYLRSELNKSRSILIYQIYKTLQPEQNRKLQDYFDRRNAERQAGSDRGSAGSSGRGRQ